jgi:hypothetical protein
MSKLRDMIDSIADENFVEAKGALTASIAEYMTGKRYVSNEDVFGSKYKNPNDEEQEMKAELAESEKTVGDYVDQYDDAIYDYVSSNLYDFLSAPDVPLDDDWEQGVERAVEMMIDDNDVSKFKKDVLDNIASYKGD